METRPSVNKYRYEFVSAVQDLLDAEEADRTARSFREPFRWLVMILGVAWLFAGVVELSLKHITIGPIVWTIMGLAILYFFGLKPWLKRSRIRRTSAPEQSIILDFNDDTIRLHTNGVGGLDRQWDEFSGFLDTKKGILFYFTDGIINWLPSRVFAGEDERNSFIEFLKAHEARTDAGIDH